MRYHITRTSPNPYLLISSSQTKHLVFPNFNIISIPSGKVQNVRQFLPELNQFDIIVLLIGGNDLFTRDGLPLTAPEQVAEELISVADELSLLAKQVFIIGIPPRFKQPDTTITVNNILEKENSSKKWKFRGVSKYWYSEICTKTDEVHLTPKSLGQLCTTLKTKILYGKYSSTIDAKGHTNTFYCQAHCKCGFWKA